MIRRLRLHGRPFVTEVIRAIGFPSRNPEPDTSTDCHAVAYNSDATPPFLEKSYDGFQ